MDLETVATYKWHRADMIVVEETTECTQYYIHRILTPSIYHVVNLAE